MHLCVCVCINCDGVDCVCTSAYAYFSFRQWVVERGHQRLKKKMNEKEGGSGGLRSQSILMPEKEMEITFVTPPMDS